MKSNPYFESMCVFIVAFSALDTKNAPNHIMTGNVSNIIQTTQDAYFSIGIDVTKKASQKLPKYPAALAYYLMCQAAECYTERDYLQCAQKASDSLKVLVEFLKQTPTTPKETINGYDATRRFMNNTVKRLMEGVPYPASAVANMRKVTMFSVTPELRSGHSVTINSQGSIRDKITKLLDGFKISTTTGIRIPAEVKDKLPEDVRKEYMSLVRDYNKVGKDEIENFVRSSGGHTAPYQDVYQYLESKNIDHTLLPGFTGRIDGAGLLYTADDKKINGVPSPNTYCRIEMNSKAEMALGHMYIFQAIKRPDAPFPDPANYYTMEFKDESTKLKHAKVAACDWDVVRAKWLKLLNVSPANLKFGNDVKQLHFFCAAMLEIIWRSLHRVGSTRGGNDKDTGFGMSTIQLRHVKLTSKGGFSIKYDGKKDGVQIYAMEPTTPSEGANPQVSALLCEVIRRLVQMEGKTSESEVWTFPMKGARGGMKFVSASDVGEYLKSIGGVTTHKIRTYHGTKLFKEQMQIMFKKVKKLPVEFQDKKAKIDGDRCLKEMGAVVGKQLAHFRTSSDGSTRIEGMTALVNYIDPGEQLAFLAHYGTRPPTRLLRLSETASQIALAQADRITQASVLRNRVRTLKASALRVVMAAKVEAEIIELSAKAEALEAQADALNDLDEDVVVVVEDDDDKDDDKEGEPAPASEVTTIHDTPTKVDIDTRFFESQILEGGIYGSDRMSTLQPM